MTSGRLAEIAASLQLEADGKLIDISDKKKKKEPPATFPLEFKDKDNDAIHQAFIQKLLAQPRKTKIRNVKRLANWIMLQVAGRRSHGKKTEETSMNLKMNELLADIAAYIEAKEAGGLCEMCGCEITANEAVEGPKGQMLCEGCAASMEA
jgi:hypothetical protein